MDLTQLLALISGIGGLAVGIYVAVGQRKAATTEEFDEFCGQLQEDNKQLRARLDANEKELANLRHELATLRADNVALRSRISELERENVQLKAQLEELQQKRAHKGKKGAP